MAGQIEGWHRLEEWFGYSPNFHDAEVVAVDLRRGSEWSLVKVHAWRTYSDLTVDGFLRTDRHTIVIFELSGISELCLDGWNHQNVLHKMWIAQLENGYELHMLTSYGVQGRIVANALKIRLEPCSFCVA